MQPPSPSRTRALVAALPLAVLLVWGCNLVDSVQADKVLAGTVIATPETDLMFLLPDASYTLPFDSGIPIHLPDGGLPFSTRVPSQTVAAIFFGQRAADYTSQPKGIAGASVTLSIDDQSFALVDKGDGAYGLSSQDDATFLYQDDATVKVTVVSAGTTYTASVKAPAKEVISQLAAVAPWPLVHTANTPLQLTRASTDNVAFTTVIEVNQNTVLTDLSFIPSTFTDVPTTALDSARPGGQRLALEAQGRHLAGEGLPEPEHLLRGAHHRGEARGDVEQPLHRVGAAGGQGGPRGGQDQAVTASVRPPAGPARSASRS
ncbi:MAG: hypothetical protein QM765_06670 [Myxococcales bacterium]